MIFYENRPLADDSHVHVISCLIFFEKKKIFGKTCRLLQS